MPKINFFKKAVVIALGAVYANEYRLIQQHCHELNIVGSFYYWFRCMFEDKFTPYAIDMEYCRMGERAVSKEINIKADECVCPFCHKKHRRRIRSDFIVHMPEQKDNLVVLEFKGNWSRGCRDWDIKKLEALTKASEPNAKDCHWVCGYKVGCSILLKEDGVELDWFEKGERTGWPTVKDTRNLVKEFNAYMRKVMG